METFTVPGATGGIRVARHRAMASRGCSSMWVGVGFFQHFIILQISCMCLGEPKNECSPCSGGVSPAPVELVTCAACVF